jgi:hypothetical protein
MTLPIAVSPRPTMGAVALPRLSDGDGVAGYDHLQSRVSVSARRIFWRKSGRAISSTWSGRFSACAECIDHMTMMAEGRRDTFLREIDRRRTSFVQRLRHAIVDAEDAEFEAVASEDAKSLAHTGTDAARILPVSLAAQGNAQIGASRAGAAPMGAV